MAVPNDSVTTRREYRRIALALLLVCVALLLMGEVAARLPRVEAFILIVGTSLAILSIVAAWRLFSPSLPRDDTRVVGASAALADEVNQALCAITANADAIDRLIEKPQPELGEVRAALADIVSDAERASAAMRGARVYATPRLEAAADIDIGQLIEQCMQQLRSEMIHHQVTCDVETAPQLPGVRGTRDQLLHLLTNMVTQVMRATAGRQQRERRLRVRASRHDVGAVAICIEDPGGALLPEQASRLCDPVCRRIVHAHGGHISVSSGAAGGAAWQLVFPASS
jgi:two-component system sensor kinase FixL